MTNKLRPLYILTKKKKTTYILIALIRDGTRWKKKTIL